MAFSALWCFWIAAQLKKNPWKINRVKLQKTVGQIHTSSTALPCLLWLVSLSLKVVRKQRCAPLNECGASAGEGVSSLVGLQLLGRSYEWHAVAPFAGAPSQRGKWHPTICRLHNPPYAQMVNSFFRGHGGYRPLYPPSLRSHSVFLNLSSTSSAAPHSSHVTPSVLHCLVCCFCDASSSVSIQAHVCVCVWESHGDCRWVCGGAYSARMGSHVGVEGGRERKNRKRSEGS